MHLSPTTHTLGLCVFSACVCASVHMSVFTCCVKKWKGTYKQKKQKSNSPSAPIHKGEMLLGRRRNMEERRVAPLAMSPSARGAHR